MAVSTLELPRLPVGGWTDLEFQVWWQEVVTRIEASVNGLNEALSAISAINESVAANEAINSSDINRLSRAVKELELRVTMVEP